MPLSLSDQPLSVIQIDETGPIYLGKDGYFVKVWILLAVEIVTRLVYLVPLKSQRTVDLITALDILQTRRGRLSRIVVDQLTGHVALKPKYNKNIKPTVKNVSPTLKETINSGLGHLITNLGFQITIAEWQRYSKVGLAESAVYSVKKLLIRMFPATPRSTDLFDFNHKLALIETYLNERPSFALHDQYFTPHIFKLATLQRAKAPLSVNSLSDTIFPSTKEIRDAVFIVSNDNKTMLTQLAAKLSRRLINYRNNTYLTDKVKVGNYIIVPDRLTLKSFSSIHSALACVLNIQDCCVTLTINKQPKSH